MLTKRTQILFDKELWQKLVALSRTQKISIGKLIRNAVEEKFTKQERLLKRQKAIDSTLENRIRLKEKINYKELINYGRKY